jgi:mannose-6-phosphate isomerase class I
VQVHPDEAAVERLGQGRPKHEAWYIAHVEPGAMLMIGHYPGFDAATLRQAAQGGTIHKWLYEVGPRVGEMFEIAAGTLHTVGAGFMLLEVQQPSDTTFRVYDWGRVGLDGKARDLHLDEASQSVAWDRFGPPKATRQEAVGPSFVMRVLRTNTELAAGPLRCLVSHSGATRIITERDELTLEYGEVAVAETDDGKIRVGSGTCLLLTEP